MRPKHFVLISSFSNLKILRKKEKNLLKKFELELNHFHNHLNNLKCPDKVIVLKWVDLKVSIGYILMILLT